MLETGNAATSSDLAARTRVELDGPYDRQLAPLGYRAIATLSTMSNERILDIGCGTGQTSVELGRIVGPKGEVLGIDLSAIVLDAAVRKAAGIPQVHFVNGDAQVFQFKPASYDGAFSRFGIMFFEEAITAFTNIRRALKPNGRLAFVCWRTLEENELDHLPLQLAYRYLPPNLTAAALDAPFSFGRAEYVRQVLEEAGFQKVDIAAHDELVGSGDLESMVELTLRVGSLGRIIRETPQARAAVQEPIRHMLIERDGPEGPKLQAATWIVSAKA